MNSWSHWIIFKHICLRTAVGCRYRRVCSAPWSLIPLASTSVLLIAYEALLSSLMICFVERNLSFQFTSLFKATSMSAYQLLTWNRVRTLRLWWLKPNHFNVIVFVIYMYTHGYGLIANELLYIDKLSSPMPDNADGRKWCTRLRVTLPLIWFTPHLYTGTLPHSTVLHSYL